MVIIEVAKSCPNIVRLLGAHRWADFLKEPEESQMATESRVYYCTKNKGREVQKHGKLIECLFLSAYTLTIISGWKRLDVEDLWFARFNPARRQVLDGHLPAADSDRFMIVIISFPTLRQLTVMFRWKCKTMSVCAVHFPSPSFPGTSPSRSLLRVSVPNRCRTY